MKRSWFVLILAAFLFAAPSFAEEKGKNEQKGNDEQKDDKDDKVDIKDLPKVVVDAVNTARPGGTIKEADKETAKDGTVVYEVDVVVGGKTYEVKVDASGKVLSNEEDKDDEKDEKKEEKK